MNLFVYQNQGIQCNCFNNANQSQQSGLKPSRNFLSTQNPLQFHRVTKSTESKIQKQQNSKIRTSLRRQKPRTPNQSRTLLYPNQQQLQPISSLNQFQLSSQNISNSMEKYGTMGVMPRFQGRPESEVQNLGGIGTISEMKRPLISRNQIPKQTHQQFKIDFNTVAKPVLTSKNAQSQNGYSYKISQTSMIPIQANTNNNKNMTINFIPMQTQPPIPTQVQTQRQSQQPSIMQAHKFVPQQQSMTPMSSRGNLNSFSNQGQGQGGLGQDLREIRDNREYIVTDRKERVGDRNVIERIQQNHNFGLRNSLGNDFHHHKGVTINYVNNNNNAQNSSLQRNEHKMLYESPTVASIDHQNMKSSRQSKKHPISKPSTPVSPILPPASHRPPQPYPQQQQQQHTQISHNNNSQNHPQQHNTVPQPQPFRMVLKQIQSVADENEHVDDQLSQVIGRGGAGWQRGSQYNYIDESFGQFYKDKDERLVTQTHATRASNIKNSSMIYQNVGTSDSHQFKR